ncbi:hypothetical protein D9758_017175 [Tetrapyrgos nigripes]|uniref:FAD-binding PCMH-type domain-containing protein n=1 Tax=Tetrapyrgos nigripes TaxID=182062 RepID=A0A8H5C2W7_9AGAR|nr:hypothetical protein D9758_017175 [Tetrapyrgos nigripes]
MSSSNSTTSASSPSSTQDAAPQGGPLLDETALALYRIIASTSIGFMLFAVSFADGAITLRVVLTNIEGDSKQKLILPIMLLVTNGITTILVGYKTWEYNKFIKSGLRVMEGGSTSNVGNILLLLVQSGFLYCVIWHCGPVLVHVLSAFGQPQSLNESAFTSDVGDVRVVFPGDPDYANASIAYNLRFEINPFAIAFPNTTEQVSTVVQAGAKHDLRVVARSALVLNEKGRGLPHGRCAYVGIGGHSGFGGWGFASRMWGMTLDNILSATVVLANGTIVEVSEDSHSELFWGIRGSSSSFAITTSVLFKTHPIPPSGGTFAQFVWDVPTPIATQAFKAYQQWALSPNLTNTIGTDFGVIKGSSARGRVLLSLLTTYFAVTPGLSKEEVEAQFNETIAPFLSSSGLPEPDVNSGSTLVTGSYIDLLGAGAVPTNGLNTTATGADMHDTFYAKSIMAPMEVPLTDEAMGGMMDYLGTAGWDVDLFWHVEVELYGGVNSAINAVPLDDTAFAHRDTLWTFQPYASSSNGLPPYPDSAFGFVDGIVSTIVDNMPVNWDYGAYPNYIDGRLEDWQHRYYGPHYPRLEALKAVVDPENVFQFHTSIEEQRDLEDNLTQRW